VGIECCEFRDIRGPVGEECVRRSVDGEDWHRSALQYSSCILLGKTEAKLGHSWAHSSG